jgi:hypothetical protein
MKNVKKMSADLDLIYTFNIVDKKIGSLDIVKEIISRYREDFNDKSKTMRELCYDYLRYEKILSNCKEVISTLTYSGQDLEDYINGLIATKYPNYFDEYYMKKYGMNRSELFELIRARTINEEKDDFDYEKNTLLLKDDILCMICDFNKSYNKYFQEIMKVFADAILGGVIARVVYEKLHGELSRQPHDLSDIQDKIYLFRHKVENDYRVELNSMILQLFEMFM